MCNDKNDIKFQEKHHGNTSLQYSANFNGCKNVIFQLKLNDLFLVFVQNIDSGG